jgi:hypothetical protein
MIHSPSRIDILILHTNFHHRQGQPLFAELKRECQRSPFHIKGREELHVRYRNNAYLLYSQESTVRLIERLRESFRVSRVSDGLGKTDGISFSLLVGDYSNYFHCVLERSSGHFHRF